MSGTGHKSRRLLLAVGAMWLAAAFLMAQPSAEEPQMFKLWLENPALVLDAEQRKETRKDPDPGQAFDEETIRLRSSIEFSLRGSVFHPNFMQLRFHAKDGLDSEEVKDLDDGQDDRSGTSFFQDYDASILFLREKPYATEVYASRHTYRRDYDFFSTVQVDSERYGLRSGYNTGRFPLFFSFSHLDEEVDDSFRPSSYDQDVATVNIQNKRSDGTSTDLHYLLNQYNRREENAFTQEGVENSIRLADSRIFGARDQMKLWTDLYGQDFDSPTVPYRSLSLQEWLANRHTANLQSDYRYNYSRTDRDDGENENHVGTAGLRHQLYKSLTSSLEIRGEQSSDEGGGSSLDRTRYGASGGEDYVKRLGTWGQLSAGYHARVVRERWTSSGSTATIIGEPQTLSDGSVTFLNYAVTDLSSIRVRDSSGTRVYLAGVDYAVISHGDRVEIRRALGGVIPNGAVVLVDYTAAGARSSNFDMFGDTTSVRLNLFDGLAGFYCHQGRQRYSGDEAPVEQEYNDTTFGMDIRWRWLTAGAERQIYDSDQSPYNATRFYESAFFQPTRDSNLSFDFRQTGLEFPDEDETERLYQFIVRYRVQVSSALSLNAEAGRQYDRGRGEDRDATTFRAGADFGMGQLTCSAHCDFQKETYRDEDRERRLLQLSVKRVF